MIHLALFIVSFVILLIAVLFVIPFLIFYWYVWLPILLFVATLWCFVILPGAPIWLFPGALFIFCLLGIWLSRASKADETAKIEDNHIEREQRHADAWRAEYEQRCYEVSRQLVRRRIEEEGMGWMNSRSESEIVEILVQQEMLHIDRT